MATPAHNVTAPSDIVVDLRGVRKAFRQLQRPAQLGALLRSLVRPTWREVRALDGIDLQVRRGEIVAYAGPNGAGKSTTIKLLAGLLSPDSGTVRALDCDPARERTRYVGRIGVVFGQRTELWWDHSVAASFEWKRVVWDIPRARYERMRELVIARLGLSEFLHTLARELSLGQRMRAELGLALLHAPELLFLDEPTLGLDVLSRRALIDFIKTLNRERDMTVLVTSHDMAELEQLAGRIVMIDHGQLAFDGDFTRLRTTLHDRRHLTLETDSASAPTLTGATLVTSTALRHEYTFDANATRIADLLAQASAQCTVHDVETQRAPIDEVIAGLYTQWQRPPV